MKRITAILLALALCLLCASAGAEEGINMLSIREWIDLKGECGDCYVLAVVTNINNPMLAIISDDTAAVNLFTSVYDIGLCEGDMLLLHSPEYNEYEGTVEMAFPEIVRQLHMPEEEITRVDAETYEFKTSPDEPIFINNQIFYGEVVILGEGQDVTFSNCAFMGNVVSYCSSATKVIIDSDCEFADGAHCVLLSSVREADMDYPLPKFMISFPVEVECPDLGGVIALGDFDVLFDGQTYSIEDAAYVQTADGSIFENDGSVAAAIQVVGQWWENEEKIVFTLASE